LCDYTTKLALISSLEVNSQRAERVVIRYFRVRIRVRGDATGAGSPPAATPTFPYLFLLAGGGVGEAA